MEKISVIAPAKLNLSLDVTGLDERGYHTLDMIMQTVPLEETSYYFTTKGDANDAQDGSAVYYKNVIGVPVFTLPYLGYLSSYLQTRRGMIIGVTAALVLLILTFMPDLLDLVDDKMKKKKKKKPVSNRKKTQQMPRKMPQKAPAAKPPSADQCIAAKAPDTGVLPEVKIAASVPPCREEGTAAAQDEGAPLRRRRAQAVEIPAPQEISQPQTAPRRRRRQQNP